jgi:hypothetical protein
MNKTKGNRRKKRIPREPSGEKSLGVTPEPENLQTQTFRRGVISVFILFHLIAITCMAFPFDLPPIRNMKDLVKPYMVWAGLFQTWDMFAPNPEAVNSYIKTVVISRDRHMHVWSFPRMEELGFIERYRKERYRKFSDVLPQPQNAPLWPDVAAHAATQFNSQSDPPEKVLLIQFESDIRPATDGAPDPAPRPSVFYDDYLQPGALQ